MKPNILTTGLLLSLLLASGCASRAEFAAREVVLCKHCNCFMPADVDRMAECTVCDCGYTNHACIHGTNERVAKALPEPSS